MPTPVALWEGGDHLDALRAQGFSDEDIVDAVEIIGFFNYYARMADALGVEAESHWAER